MLTVQNIDEEEPEPDTFPDGILNPTKQKQKKSNLAAVLNLTRDVKLKKRFQNTLFSRKGLDEFGMREIEAIAVLRQLDTWARSGNRTFDTWKEAVTAALAEVRNNLSLASPSTIVSKSLSHEESTPETELCAMCMNLGSSCGFTFKDQDCQFILNTSVDMHEKGRGAKAGSINFKFACQTIFENSPVIIQCVELVDPVCRAIDAGEEFNGRSFLLNLLQAVVGGTILKGKFGMVQKSLAEMGTLLPSLKMLRSRGSILEPAWLAICAGVLKTVFQIEPKVIVKLCRELRTANYFLTNDSSLMLRGYEIKIIGSKSVLAEFDLEFIELCPGSTTVVEVESEKGGKAEYYAGVWSPKAKRFRKLGLSGRLCFTVAYPDFLEKKTAAKIRQIAKKEFGEDLLILSVSDPTLTSRVMPPRQPRRRNSFSGSSRSMRKRPRSKSVDSR